VIVAVRAAVNVCLMMCLFFLIKKLRMMLDVPQETSAELCAYHAIK
jgi:hypothetical protein